MKKPNAIQLAIDELLNKLERNVAYGGHPAETEFNRSEARVPLISIGPPCFLRLIPRMKRAFFYSKKSDWCFNYFGIMIWLISSIRDQYTLPATPYPKNTVFKDMQIGPWIKYLRRCAYLHQQ